MEQGSEFRGRAHFSSAIAHDFPTQLLTVKYEIDKCSDQLVLSLDHQYGQPVANVDLHLWPHLQQAFDRAAAAHYTVSSATAAEHVDVNEVLIRYLAGSPVAQSLTSFDIARCANISTEGLRVLAELPHLQHLGLAGISSVDDSVLKTITDHVSTLTALDISMCMSVTNDGLHCIACSLHDSLLSLKASGNSNFTHVGVNDVLMQCELLEVLDISRSPKLTFLGIVLQTHGLFQFVSRKLKILNVDSCGSLHPQSLNWISSALGGLEELSLKNVPAVTDSVIKGVLVGCLGLRTLHYSGCRQVTGQSLCVEDSTDILTHLSCAGLGNLSSAVVSKLLLGRAALEHLDLSHNLGIGDEAFTETFTALNALRSSSHGEAHTHITHRLKTLEIGNCSISSYGLSCAAQLFANLERLNCAGLKNIEDSALKVLGSCCPHLMHLNINDCSRVTDVGVVFICKHIRLLTTLHLSYTSVVTDMRTAGSETYDQYTGKNPSLIVSFAHIYIQNMCLLYILYHIYYLTLSHLAFDRCSDKVLRAILSRAHNLREVTLCNQRGLTLSKSWFFDVFPRVGNYCLQRLDLRGCENITGNYLHCTLASCHLLNDVELPAHFVETGVSSEGFWRSTFRAKVHAKRQNIAFAVSQ
jgi:hypothetical protein